MQTLMGRRVCSVIGSSPLSRVEIQRLTQPSNIAKYPNNESCLTDLLNNTGVDAMTTDDTIPIGLANRYPGQLKLVGPTFSEDRPGHSRSPAPENRSAQRFSTTTGSMPSPTGSSKPRTWA